MAFVLGLGGCYRTLSFQVTRPRTSYPSVKPRRNLVPVQGEDPIMGKCKGPRDVLGSGRGVSLPDELSGQNPV